MEDYTIPLGYIVAEMFLLSGGLVVQSFIVTMNLMDQMKGKVMTATDHIITSLGISRFIFHFASFCIVLQLLVFQTVPVIFRVALSLVAWLSTYSSFWLSVLLAAFLCLKISNFHNVFFLRLRVMISRKVVHVIVLSVLLSCIYSSLVFMVSYNGYLENSTEAHIFNRGIPRREVKTLLLFLWNIICFFIYFLSSVLITVPICLHMNRMRTESSAASKMDVFVKTLTFVIASFLTYVTYVIINQLGDDIVASFGVLGLHIIWNVFPLLHSVYLIFATAKLRNRLRGILRHGTKCLVGRSSGGAVEMITQ